MPIQFLIAGDSHVNPITAALLGHIAGDVSNAHRLFDVESVLAQIDDANADACRNHMRPPMPLEGGEIFSNAFPNLSRSGRIALLQEHTEFVAAKTAKHVAFSQTLPNA